MKTNEFYGPAREEEGCRNPK